MDDIYYKKFYRAWHSMKQRCGNKNNPQYFNYGGRGITYHDKWFYIRNFYKDMWDDYMTSIETNGIRNTSIDRIDNNGNYCKENCRWVTQKEQCNNRRQKTTRSGERLTIPINGINLSMKDISNLLKTSYKYVYSLYSQGYDLEKWFNKRMRQINISVS